MANIELYKTRIENEDGTKAFYPHTSQDVVFDDNGKNLKDTLNNIYNGSTKVGKATTADSATNATSVVDYNKSGHTIQIGWFGSSISTADSILTFACYTNDNGIKIKDASLDTVKSKLGLSSYATTTSVTNKLGRTDNLTAANTSYTTSMARAIAFATSTPSSITNGSIVEVYE